MPTFRNDTEFYIDFDDFIIRNERREHVIVRFKPGEERKLNYWPPSGDPPSKDGLHYSL